MIHETHGRHGQEEERLQLVVCCRTRGKLRDCVQGNRQSGEALLVIQLSFLFVCFCCCCRHDPWSDGGCPPEFQGRTQL